MRCFRKAFIYSALAALLVSPTPTLCKHRSSGATASLGVGGEPEGYDDWCEQHCSSIRQCAKVFGNDFVDLRIRTDFSALDGPGKSLTNGIFLGDTISRQTFTTQFILDVSSALSMSPCRLYIMDVSPEKLGHSWDSNSVFVTFRLFPAESTKVRELTAQIQDASSDLYKGKVTAATDSLYGLVTTKWDFSIKLAYAISIVGSNSVENLDGIQYLNQGSERWCTNTANSETPYCEFERFFKADLAWALSIAPEQVDVLFVKPSGRDSVIVSFRFLPVGTAEQDASWIHDKANVLLEQIGDATSLLYQGNVTFRVDPTWGVSNMHKAPRTQSKYLRRSVRDSRQTDYERCKATHRCSRGWVSYDQTRSYSSSTMQTFPGGQHVAIPLFADFEDWRLGTHGWSWSCKEIVGDEHRCLSAGEGELNNTEAPLGSHWSPFQFPSLGPNIPSFNASSNNGLVLNNASLMLQLEKQSAWITDIRSYIQWLDYEMNVTSLDATTRSRIDIQNSMRRTVLDYTKLLSEEEAKYDKLSMSQCRAVDCSLLFNTSSLEMSGAINATGTVATTPDGTEVAVWSFDSIDLDEGVKTILTGQRAMALVSRSSIRIDTSLRARPGTLGGFPGGYSVSRQQSDRLVSVCNEEVDLRESADQCGIGMDRPCCPGDQPISLLSSSVVSNNINGPGSGSVRVYLKTIETIAPVVNKVQTITTDANRGQTLAGGFKLHFGGYSTAFIPHHATARDVKEAMEDSLNAAKLDTLNTINRTDVIPGLGRVSVSRASVGTSGGYAWNITYASAVGNPGELSATNLLTGKGASVSVQTVTEGNAIGGTFDLSFLGSKTRAVPHDVSASDLQTVLLHDISALIHVHVIRSDPTNKCDAGFCANGPTRAGGYTWILSLTTHVGNVSPFSPTSAAFDDEGDDAEMTATTNLTGCVHKGELACPEVIITNGHGRSHIQAMKNLVATKPFSLSYGGGGAGHGGAGGEGFGSKNAGDMYGDSHITNLHGGSGGALGFTQPFEIIMFDGPRARGGSGGGAIEIVAANDITLGPKAVISCDGENGSNGSMTGGGGGSGGTVLLSAGGAIHHDGEISANGGDGGYASQPNGRSDIKDGHGGGGGGGRVALYGESLAMMSNSSIEVHGGHCSTNGVRVVSRNRDCNAKDGTIHLDSNVRHVMFADFRKGAAGTSGSIRLKGHEPRPSTPPSERTSSTRGGPEFDLGRTKRPGRVSFFVQLGHDAGVEKMRTGWGTSLELRSERWSDVANSPESNFTAVIGVSVGPDMKHGANLRGIPHDTTHLKEMDIFHSKTELARWYKIDIRLNWKAKHYDLYLDDVLVVQGAPFVAEGIRAVAISNFHPDVDAWFDEIFVGDDSTMGFKCPIAADYGPISMGRPGRRGWKASEMGGTSYSHDMQRHESHISRRPLYNRADNGGLVPFDGSGHSAFSSDVKFRPSETSAPGNDDSNFLAGSLLKIPLGLQIEQLPAAAKSSDGHGRLPNSFVWYGEHDNSFEERDGYLSANHIRGGVAACSTTDFKTWKNEGIMLHYANLTDMVEGSDGPFHVERPKVLYNNATNKFVMWMVIDNEGRDLAMAAVAVSDAANGPFEFVRSFYPDGNQTRDQTLYQDADGTAYLVRTYYATIDFVLPAVLMQPTWESVKDANGDINFALTHHRASYEPAYDNYHDIYLQRWRTEDKPWKVVCVDRLTGKEREVPYGKENLNHDGEVCNDPFEYKMVLGQGNPLQENTKDGIQSRFLDPNDPANNVWMPNSVPGVKAQPWRENYRDGSCGVRQLDDDMSHLDPSLTERDVRDRGDCSNIADNPIHRTAPDKLIGSDRIVEQRRAKFVAISRLTDDYLDTTGVLASYEGELEEGTDIIALVGQAKAMGGNGENGGIPFGWTAGNNLSSTRVSQVHSNHFQQADDWDTRFHQYEDRYNDRARYSTACVLDGQCNVNQITEGHA